MDKEQAVRQATDVDEVALPVEMVQLKHMRTKSGGAVWVQCESVDELRLLPVLKQWSGLHPPVSPLQGGKARRENEAEVAMVDAVAPGLLQLGTVLHSSTGEVRPAFYVGERPKGSKALPFHLLKQEDRVELVTAILRQSGYIPGGAADSGSFSRGKRGRNKAGRRAVGGGKGKR